MKVLTSGLALLSVLVSAQAADVLSGSKLITYPSNVPVKQGSYIVEFSDDSAPPSAIASFASSFQSIPDVNVDSHFDTLFNGIAVTTANHVDPIKLTNVAGVKRVWPVRYHSSPVLSSSKNITYPYLHHMTGVNKVLQDLGIDGKGVKIGIVDSGVDYHHPELGNCWKTKGCKWQYGQDFIGDKYNPNDPNPVIEPNPTPMDCAGHGTHVSGIIGATGPRVYGVAPGATLGMYRVFSCPVNGEVSSSDDIILKGIEAAYKDGQNVISLSLGGGAWPEDPTAVACSKLTRKGVVVVAANGNDGESGLFTAGSPAVGHGVISVGSIDNWNITGYTATFTTPKGVRNALMSTPGSESHPFVFANNIPVVAPLDSSGSTLGCSEFKGSLKGKVAMIQRGNCTFTLKAQNAEKAGATAAVIYNNVEGMLSPAVDASVSIPVIIIPKADGDFVVKGINAGPSTVKAPKGQTGTFPGQTGGQMSSFSSFGPSPELDMNPLISAPGGNIWSTYPLKLGGYASLSGTSMATPYISGSVALLKQARPELSVDDVRYILSSSAKPLNDAKTGKDISPNWSGSGLVNVYDAIKSRATISPSALSINDTNFGSIPGLSFLDVFGSIPWTMRKVTIKNTDKHKTMDVRLHHSTADSLSNYAQDGSLLKVPRTWPADKSDVPYFTVPQVYTLDARTRIRPGHTEDVNVLIVAPVGLKDSEEWFYSGFLKLSMTWEGENKKTQHVVPFAGYNGNYRDLNILSPSSTGVPAITTSNQTTIQDLSKFTVTSSNTGLLIYSLDVPSRVVAATLIDSSGKAVGYLPGGYTEYAIRNLPGGKTPVSGIEIANTVFADKEGQKSVKVPAGKYHVQLSALRPLGNPNDNNDYQTWNSGVFNVA